MTLPMRSWLNRARRSNKHSRRPPYTHYQRAPNPDIDWRQWDVPSTTNDLDFVAPVRSALLFFILSLKALAFVMLSKAMKAKKLRRTPIKSGYIFCTREIATVLRLDLHSGRVRRSAESFKAIGIGYLVNLNHNINWRRGGASVYNRA